MRKLHQTLAAGFFAAMMASAAAQAGKADVRSVDVIPEGEGRYTFRVTIQHDDEGWDHYADKWQVRTAGGQVLGTRVLRHPHSKAPFTRSLDGVKVPDGVRQVTIRAHDKVHGWGGASLKADLPDR